MNRIVIYIVAIAGVVSGCSKPGSLPLTPRPAVLSGYVRLDDPSLTADVANAIQTAKTHLEKTDGQPVDAMYKVTKTASGFDVHVEYVTGYDTSGQPMFVPGGHCNVVISTQGSVVKVQPGA
jgi:hypothetical protein